MIEASVLPPPRGLVNAMPILAGISACVVAGIAAPFLFPGVAILTTLTVMYVWMAVNMSWNLVLGVAGIFSFGQVAFFAVGAYAATILNVHLGFAPWLDTLAGGAAGGVTALLIGLATIRLRGVYVALVTLAFHELLRTLVSTDYSGLTGGPNGLTPARYVAAPDLLIQAQVGYWIAFVGAVMTALLLLLVLRSPIGVALVAARDAEHVSTARGVMRVKYQMIAFVLSGAIAGLMGAFYAHYIGVVSPTLLSFGLLISLLSMLIVGGVGTFWGPIVGTGVMTFITRYLQGAFPQYQSLIVAIILVVMVLLFRAGLVGTMATAYKRFATHGRAQ